MPKWSFTTNLNISKHVQGIEFGFAQGSYEVVDIIEMIQEMLNVNSIPIEISLDRDKNRVVLKLKRKNLKKKEVCTLVFNGYLNKILGFSVKGDSMRYDLTRKSNYIEACIKN